ncbi:MAG: enoyl-CoA hydratase/isomerase family protein [candidate division Zixibacteria bacterium]|nr:enoyl-CoA hydratase/isomerase family protein [candidate division Zixibacteria bacterium]
MNSGKTVRVERQGPVARVIFCRPEIHNAFNDQVIDETTFAFSKLKTDLDTRVVILTGEGKSFCAGADLNWMRRVKEYAYEDNLEESRRLADLFYNIYSFPKPVIGRINGAAIGGGTGFVAVTDIAVAAQSAIFSFSEVKIGVVPACISPYVIKRVGQGRAREFFLTGERLTAERALTAGLVNRVVPDDMLDATVNGLVESLLSSGPQAIAVCKDLLQNVPGLTVEQFREYTARVIADLRQSAEGQEGMDAFLNKRKPNWVIEKE